MEVDQLVKARRLAEASVRDMDDGPLKEAAFTTILTQVLQQNLLAGSPTSLMAPAGRGLARRKKGSAQRSDGTTARLLGLVDEGYFAQQRSLAEIRDVLAERGWHYQVEDLGTAVTRLVRPDRKCLRRVKVAESGKRLWRYSNY